MPISYETFERVALEDGDGHWELVCGRLRKKPAMTYEHNETIDAVSAEFHRQLDRTQYIVRADSAQVLISTGWVFVPDLLVALRDLARRVRSEHPGQLEVYAAPLPLVVEVWSRSTADYDVNTKLPEYMRRQDREIWFIHPYERWLRAWRRQADGTYTQTLLTGEAVIAPVALPGVRIALAALFE
ncbi:MAG TPA: Uma2 family endonuclease [Dehalococcoidia bacterium]|nr:Uma2 family endonuclease [Dehalococcoidia bacterium]